MDTAKPKHFRTHDACRLHGDNGSSARDEKTKKIIRKSGKWPIEMGSVVFTRRNQPRPCPWQWTLYVAMVVSRVKRDGIKMYENALGVYTH